MNKTKLTLIFLIINFLGLWFGTLLMNNGPQSEWYFNLSKAPWTPPGWVFGTAWTIIMICFSIYLGDLFSKNNTKNIQLAFIIQFILNVSWNYVFFNQHLVSLGLIVLLLLNVVLYYFFFSLKKNMTTMRFLLLPYMVWMSIATSLNLYILIHN
ncbi:TspO/MBR family protein [Tenacibaculum amylolyticum]|uniref:TspO/MBR family protein n=1 Tax=Tenacibaculum amylolyticum TaxID=104269 RepID=UPI0038933652